MRHSAKAIKEIVTKLTEEHSINSVPVDIEKLAILVGAEVKRDNFEDTLAGFIYLQGDMKLIGVNASDSLQRQRFTIAHELGHMHLDKEAVSYDRDFAVKMRDEHSKDGTDPIEINANLFAAELLMPEDKLRQDVAKLGNQIDPEDDEKIGMLAERYAVSRMAMTVRLTNLFRLRLL